METEEKLKLSNQICFPMYAASRLITKAYKPLLDELGITYPQYLVLLVLWEKDNVSVKYISQKLILETNTITPLLKRMEKSMLISRKRSEADERSVFVTLTSEGKKLKNKAAGIPDKLVNQLSSPDIPAKDIISLQKTLCTLIDKLNDQ
ncbi:MarR family winged helix-turn-helix transcriptional regulator [Marinigracilibium pacificum]|uniref:HTH-type transcriptional regulator SarZ n=1 Tax=Marinigracilibium pacificum TaxID=2729599 RepID=A0A848J6P2_9BACT|nr:MarR family transcriptional regulator [Marinigracilibium pacificum]NMM50124.1 MarR family transcriptional regulator [Marinigracilibium pacificum]